jgi:HEPN domain-containing protein
MGDNYLNEAKKWLNKAESDFRHAISSEKLKDFDWSQVAAQQSSEKALKSVCISRGYGIIKIHDLTILAKKLNAPLEIIEKTAILNSFYSASRYPDAQELFDDNLNKVATTDAIKSAEVILKWCKAQIKI